MAIQPTDLVDYYMALERRVARLERTSTVANSQSDTTFVGLLAVTGLAVDSQTVVAYGTDFQVYIKFTWSAVSLDSNVITDDPLRGYLTSWTKDGTNYTAEKFSTDTEAVVGPLAQGQNITFRVRAVTQKNTYGAYSSTNVTSTLDNTAPNQPSTPTATPYLGQIRVYWDGLDVGSGAMPGDLVACEIHISTSSITFTPTAATLVDVFYPGGGYYTITDLTYGTTYYVRLVAVDKVGNRSPTSTGVSVVPVQASDGDIADLSIGKLTVGTLSADMTISARIKTANTGARVEVNTSGLQAYNSSGTKTVEVSSSTGLIDAAGKFSTGLSGASRIDIDASGTYPTIYMKDSSNNTQAFINSPGGGIGVNTANWTSGLDGSTSVTTRMYLLASGGGRMEITRASDQNRFGAYADINNDTFEGGYLKYGTTQRCIIKAQGSKVEMTAYDSTGDINQIYAKENEVKIYTDPNDDPMHVELGDGNMYTYGRNGNMSGSSLGMFLHGEQSFSSVSNQSLSWGASMASQVDTVLTIESSTTVAWTMTGSGSTGWSWQTSGTSISGFANWIGIRR